MNHMISFYLVQEKGLEPPLLSELDPKSSASTSFATLARIFFILLSRLFLLEQSVYLYLTSISILLRSAEDERTKAKYGGLPWSRTKDLQIKSLLLYQLS